jgi:outer membrane lipoprotein-sorting protein
MNISLSTFRKLVPLAALVLSAAALPLAPARSAPPASQPSSVDQAISALRAISTMRADFVQTDRKGQRIAGVMTLQRPGRIRFQYQKGVPLLIVSDGAALTLIDYEVRQVQRWPIRNSPLGALLDPNKDVARFARPIATGNPGVLSVEIKDPRHPEYGTITMVMVKNAAAPGGFALDSWVSFDAQAARTSVRLTNQRYGIAVPANTFRWNDPRLPTRR